MIQWVGNGVGENERNDFFVGEGDFALLRGNLMFNIRYINELLLFLFLKCHKCSFCFSHDDFYKLNYHALRNCILFESGLAE